ncbi:unnamed protein product [Eruca vesicaria subsp. sativa]|uniref:Chalcone/stilbene synthase C-terminal domain-containing protein n=1 Tax=Eruca vesicaria subsp. sativa TaxID=29727 RepID=A0ABC8LAP3_ERUVS|nr:unnamed protein product [Eruca vesicaria subsp. sativa]
MFTCLLRLDRLGLEIESESKCGPTGDSMDMSQNESMTANDATVKRQGTKGKKFTLSRELPQIIEDNVESFCKKLIGKAGLTPKDYNQTMTSHLEPNGKEA